MTSSATSVTAGSVVSGECPFCSGHEDAIGLFEVWADEHWRLFADLSSEVLGFALQAATGAESVYVYVFDHPHLHVHLGPHIEGDALNHQIIRGEMVRSELSGGLRRDVSVDFPLLPEPELRTVAEQVRRQLS